MSVHPEIVIPIKKNAVSGNFSVKKSQKHLLENIYESPILPSSGNSPKYTNNVHERSQVKTETMLGQKRPRGGKDLEIAKCGPNTKIQKIQTNTSSNQRNPQTRRPIPRCSKKNEQKVNRKNEQEEECPICHLMFSSKEFVQKHIQSMFTRLYNTLN